MRTGIVAASLVLFSVIAVPAVAQTRTVPPTLDFTCHGYDEGATRAYNCIPEPSQQQHMQTFVPPPESACIWGSIKEFPAGRIVFQIRCSEEAITTPTTPIPTSEADIKVVNVRRYQSASRVADWLKFTVRSDKRALKTWVHFRVSFQQGAYTSVCAESSFLYNLSAVENETTSPGDCGTDEQWSSVTIDVTSPENLTCSGCDTYTFNSLPISTSLTLDSADPHEVPAFIEEATLKAQMGAARGQR